LLRVFTDTRATDSARGWESDPLDLRKPQLVRLRDGSNVTVRRAGPGDEAALRSFLSGLCLEAKRLRFFTGAADMNYAAHLGVAAIPTTTVSSHTTKRACWPDTSPV
jgi:hypothetical protein